MTLLEVVGAMALLATLLVGSLTAFARHEQQIRRSQDLLDTNAAVQAMLLQWYRSPTTIARQATGTLGGQEEMVWNTQVVDSRFKETLGFETIRFTLRRETDDEQALPILSLELVIPAKKWPPSEAVEVVDESAVEAQ